MSHSRTAGQDGSRSRHRLPAALLTGLLAAGALAGCGPAPELGRGAASQLQTQVLAVSQAAASKKVAKHPPEPLPKARPTAKSGGAAKKLSSKTAEKSISSKKAPKPKEKLVRDSFTMPQEDYALIAGLKNRALMFRRPTKKSELLRAGLHALQALPAATLREALDSLTPLKVGRPKRGAL